MLHLLLIDVLLPCSKKCKAEHKSLTLDQSFFFFYLILFPDFDRPRQKSNEKEGWRSKFLLKMPTSLPKINDRTDRQVYKSLAQFRTDCATVLHNIAVFHGGPY